MLERADPGKPKAFPFLPLAVPLIPGLLSAKAGLWFFESFCGVVLVVLQKYCVRDSHLGASSTG